MAAVVAKLPTWLETATTTIALLQQFIPLFEQLLLATGHAVDSHPGLNDAKSTLATLIASIPPTSSASASSSAPS